MKRLLSRRKRRGWTWAQLSDHSGLPTWKLQWWQKRFSRRESGRRPARTFVPVQVIDPPRVDGPPLEVITGSGARILVGVEFSADHLKRVMKALDGPC